MKQGLEENGDLYLGQIPDVFSSFPYAANKRNRAVIRYALSKPQKLIDGNLSFSSSAIERATGEKSDRICEALKEMVEYGLLEITDETYVPGKRSRKFRAIGALLEAAHIVANSKPVVEIEPPEASNTGFYFNRHEGLWRAMCSFRINGQNSPKGYPSHKAMLSILRDFIESDGYTVWDLLDIAYYEQVRHDIKTGRLERILSGKSIH